MLKAIGICFLALSVLFLFGQLWFHPVEGLLSKIKSLLHRNKPPTRWYCLKATDDNEQP
ncbi:MAG: hypothetical protein UI647_05385 [Negativibacillus sp.]